MKKLGGREKRKTQSHTDLVLGKVAKTVTIRKGAGMLTLKP